MYLISITAVIEIIRFRRSEYSHKAVHNITNWELKDIGASARSINQFQLSLENHITALNYIGVLIEGKNDIS